MTDGEVQSNLFMVRNSNSARRDAFSAALTANLPGWIQYNISDGNSARGENAFLAVVTEVP